MLDLFGKTNKYLNLSFTCKILIFKPYQYIGFKKNQYIWRVIDMLHSYFFGLI